MVQLAFGLEIMVHEVIPGIEPEGDRMEDGFSTEIIDHMHFANLRLVFEGRVSEARKFGVSVVSANQFLDQYPAEMRAAILAVGSHAFFQLSSADANQVAQALDGGKPLAEKLKNLPQRHAIVKTGAERYTEIRIPTIHDPNVDYTDLLNRSRYQWGRIRAHIERDIAKRQAVANRKTEEVLDGWE